MNNKPGIYLSLNDGIFLLKLSTDRTTKALIRDMQLTKDIEIIAETLELESMDKLLELASKGDDLLNLTDSEIVGSKELDVDKLKAIITQFEEELADDIEPKTREELVNYRKADISASLLRMLYTRFAESTIGLIQDLAIERFFITSDEMKKHGLLLRIFEISCKDFEIETQIY